MSVGEKETNPSPPGSEAENPSTGSADGAPPESHEQTPEAAAAEEAPPPAPEPPAEDPQLVELRTALEAARRDLEQSQSRLRAVSKAYTDLQGEMRSFKERMEARAKLDSELQAYDQVKNFFDPVMNLKRSIANPGDDVKVLVEGLQIVHHQFMEALKRLGLEEIPGVGSTFDPNLHEALAISPVSDPALDGKVLEVHTSGYTVRGRVLQAAQVVIGKRMETSGEA